MSFVGVFPHACCLVAVGQPEINFYFIESTHKLFAQQYNSVHRPRPTSVPLNRAAVSVLVGPCCPALLKLYRFKCEYCCIIGQIKNDDE